MSKASDLLRGPRRGLGGFDDSWRSILDSWNESELQHGARWLLYLVLVGLVAGGAALLFDALSTLTAHTLLHRLANWAPQPPGGEAHSGPAPSGPIRYWVLALLPALGGLASGLLVQRFAPEAAGHGTDAAIHAYHHKAGYIRPMVPPIKMLASAITLGTAGSGGREGPIAQTGAGFGSLLASRLRLSAEDRRVLMAAGMGAGVGSIFRAPLAGALFASEIFYRSPEFESSVMIPACISSIVAYCTFTLVHGTGTLFRTPDLTFTSPLELVAYSVLAVVLVVFGFIYVQTFYGLHEWFAKLRAPRWVKPMLGGLLTGALGVGLCLLTREPLTLSVLGIGYGVVQHALDTGAAPLIGVGVLTAVALGKILTTSLTIGSGGSAGVFGPSMVIGGCVGGAVGSLLHYWYPHLAPQPAAFVVVGMAGFFSGIAKTPISTLVMVSEMTGSYALLLPALWVCVATFALSRRWNLYSEQVEGRIASPAHRDQLAVDVLDGVKVRDVQDPNAAVRTLRPGDSLDHLLDVAAQCEQSTFPVVDERGRLSGLISMDDLRLIINEDLPPQLLVAQDLMRVSFPSVTPDTDLGEAMRLLTGVRLDELPITDDDHGRLLGLLSRRRVTRAYVDRWEALGARRIPTV